MDLLGVDEVSNYVGTEPSGGANNTTRFNSEQKPHNPINIAGGIMVCSLIKPELSDSNRY